MAATKEQERKVLEQIRKMVEELGTDSYIAMAFEGCFEIAESNIDNDFGCSMKQRVESAERKAETAVQREKAAEKAREKTGAADHRYPEPYHRRTVPGQLSLRI